MKAVQNRRAMRQANRPLQQGFTLLEVMIVMTIIIILATLAAGSYQKSLEHANEAALRQDLAEIQKAIDNYTMDKEAAPDSLDQLVPDYLHEIPMDPITHQRYWATENCDTLLSPEQTSTGICTAHSASDAVSPFDNTPYSTWKAY